MAYLLTPALSTAMKDELLITQDEISRLKETKEDDDKSIRLTLSVSDIVRLAERVSPWESDPTSPYAFTLNLKLVEIGGNTEHEVVKFTTKPENMIDIKRKIEGKFNIAVCAQELLYKGELRTNYVKVPAIGMKSKDAVEIRYTSTCDLQATWICMKWFDYLQRFWDFFECTVWTGTPAELQYVLVAGLRDMIPQHILKLFSPFSEKKCRANRQYFDDMGGTRSVHKTLERLVCQPWRYLPVAFRILEQDCINILTLMLKCKTLQNNIERLDTIGFIGQSFLRFRIKSDHSKLVDESGCAGPAEHNNLLAINIIRSCMQFFVNVREYKEFHDDMTANPDLMRQLVNTVVCPSFPAEDTFGSITTIGENLIRTSEYANRMWVLETLMKGLEYRRKLSPPLYSVALEFSVQFAIAIIILKAHVSRRVFPKLISLLEDRDALPLDTDNMENREMMMVAPPSGLTFLSTIKLLYPSHEINPYKFRKGDAAVMKHVQGLAKVVVFSALELYISDEGSPYRAHYSFEKDNTMQFFLCLPSYVPARIRPRVHKMVRSVCKAGGSSVIPTLKGLCLSYFAANVFGVELLLGKSFESIHSEILMSRDIERMEHEQLVLNS